MYFVGNSSHDYKTQRILAFLIKSCYFLTSTYSLWGWSFSPLDYFYLMVPLDRRWKAPLLPIVFHAIEKIVPWSPCFGIEHTF